MMVMATGEDDEQSTGSLRSASAVRRLGRYRHWPGPRKRSLTHGLGDQVGFGGEGDRLGEQSVAGPP
jgi:hypothetical protein